MFILGGIGVELSHKQYFPANLVKPVDEISGIGGIDEIDDGINDKNLDLTPGVP